MKEYIVKNNNPADLEEWFDNKITLNPYNEKSMADLYENYEKFHKTLTHKQLPLNPRPFAFLVKKRLEKDVAENKVEFRYRKRSRVKGVELNVDEKY